MILLINASGELRRQCVRICDRRVDNQRDDWVADIVIIGQLRFVLSCFQKRLGHGQPAVAESLVSRLGGPFTRHDAFRRWALLWRFSRSSKTSGGSPTILKEASARPAHQR